jgi:alkanesulfonate monooxygenase SsuD/methylene tetrahydromethanopterin reductase-like flavin-dependent oxidoreductase (luciferase family)
MRATQMSKEMAKRVFATVPDTVAEELEQWADQQGRSLSNLVGFLLENSLRTAKERGEFKPSEVKK